MWTVFKNIALAAGFSGSLFAAEGAIAQGVPTFDPQNLTQQIQQIRHMLEDSGSIALMQARNNSNYWCLPWLCT